MKKTITRRNFLKKSSKFVAAAGLGGCGILLKGCTLNKDFDLIIIPNKRHGLGDHPYFIRKRWDYFVHHLLGVIPPKEYKIGDGSIL